MKNLFSRFVKDESGATAIEYGLIAGLLSIVILGALQLTGTTLDGVFSKINTEVGKAG
ncbi:Flp family type IVb pilin [Roseibium sp. SCPC15]|jgi:pilus assembly protein Flp/PilA|uniref:Flp family type IVb pilin n=1 Tax=Roseibium sp. SCP15 TaxID=3141376 RepID=UPI00333D6D2A